MLEEKLIELSNELCREKRHELFHAKKRLQSLQNKSYELSQDAFKKISVFDFKELEDLITHYTKEIVEFEFTLAGLEQMRELILNCREGKNDS